VITGLVEFWRRLRLTAHPAVRRAIRVEHRGALPPTLLPRRLYLVGYPPKWAILRCPCGREHDIQLNLLNAERARWAVEFDDRQRPSLAPSVDVRAERRCHFWLIHGRVRWCEPPGARLPWIRPGSWVAQRDRQAEVCTGTENQRGTQLGSAFPGAGRRTEHKVGGGSLLYASHTSRFGI